MKLCELRKERIITTELSFWLTMQEIEKIAKCVDAIAVPALKKTCIDYDPKAASFSNAVALKRKHIEPIVTVTCRDFRKKDASFLDKLLAYGIKNLLVVYGDKHAIGRTCYGFKSTAELIKWIKNYSKEFCFLVACDPNKDADKELERILVKEKAGASMVVTQPIFNLKKARILFEMISSETNLKIIAGLAFPNVPEQIEFLRNRLAIDVPEHVVSKLAKKPTKQHILKFVDKLSELVSGFHIYPVGNKESFMEAIEALSKH